MLTLRDSLGNDLVAVTPQPASVALTTPRGTPFSISVLGVEDDANLEPISLSGTVTWNDGVNSDVYTSTSNGTLAIKTPYRYLSPGFHNVGVLVRNYRAPVNDEVQVNFSITVSTSTTSNDVKNLYGPILPKDSGYPNAQQWNFNMDSDLAVLASSVKMLLETQIGERIMEPTYGTDIRSVIFEPNLPGIETLIQEKLVQALTRWEPRVSVSSVSAQRNTDRSVLLDITLVSLLTNKAFNISTNFSQ